MRHAKIASSLLFLGGALACGPLLAQQAAGESRETDPAPAETIEATTTVTLVERADAPPAAQHTTIATGVPTTIATGVPTTIATGVPTTIATGVPATPPAPAAEVPTTIATGVPTTIATGVPATPPAPAAEVPTTIATGVPTTIATGVPATPPAPAADVPTTIATGVPTTIATGVPATPPAPATDVPTTIATGVPTTIATGVPTTIATGVPTTIATGVPATTATGAVPPGTVPGALPAVGTVTPAAGGIIDPASYEKRTEFDNTPWRFNMEQDGRRMTADEFTAWMEARGVRVARGAGPQPAAPIVDAIPGEGLAIPADVGPAASATASASVLGAPLPAEGLAPGSVTPTDAWKGVDPVPEPTDVELPPEDGALGN